MLQLILGKAGTGKTTTILNSIEQTVAAGQKALFIVPEQFSFESERTLLQRLGPSGVQQVEVFSFTRLSQQVFRECGGLAGRRLDQTGRYLIMNLALAEVSDALEVYRRQSRQSSFVSTLVEVVTELKLAGAYPEDLLRVAQDAGSRFAAKLRELSLIYSAYQAIVERSFTDPHDDITRAGRLAGECRFFEGMHLFVDSFTYFSAAERRMLLIAIEQAQEVQVALCCDSLSEREDDTGIFSSARRTANRLISGAKRALVKVAPPLVLETPHRFTVTGITRVEQLLSSGYPVQEREDMPGLEVACAPDPYAEAEYAAAAVHELVRSGLQYRDIVVITRNIEDRLSEIESAFSRRHIPFYADRNTPASAQPLALALLGALDCTTGSMTPEGMLRLAKCPALGQDATEVAQLENYSFIWSLTGRQWREPFARHPFGADTAPTPESERVLARLNRTREGLLEPLLRLERRLKGCDGTGFAAACYHYLEEIQAAQNLRNFAATLPALEQKSLLELSEALWQELMNMLDLFAATLGDAHLPADRLAEILRLSLSSLDLGQIPRTIDQVVCGSAGRMIAPNPKAAIVMGVNEGVFPAALSSGGIFTDSEITGLYEAGVEISQPALELALGERFYLYTALTAPSQWLMITYAQSSNSGSPMEPSQPLRRICAAMAGPVRYTDTLDPVSQLSTPETAFALLAAQAREDSILRATLEAYFAQAGQGEAAARLGAAAQGWRIHPIQRQTALRLLGERLRLSPTKLERFFNCPFQYFCQDALRILPRKKVEFSPLESGTVIHLVLERMVQRHGGAPLAHIPVQELEDEVSAIITGFLQEYAGGEQTLPARQAYLFRRLVNLLVRILRRLGAEFLQSAFVPAGFEVTVGQTGEVRPMEMPTEYGQVVLEGKIDRVDVYENDTERFVRVVDYKSGAKRLSLSKVYEGLNIQMLIYLFSLCEGESGRFTGSLPAGVLYMPAKAEAVSIPRTAGQEEAEAELEKGMKQNGLLLGEQQLLEAMEHGLSGRFIPVRLTSTGLDKRALTASRGQMEDIKRRIRELVCGMSEHLYLGRITPNPARSEGRVPCDYCNYKKLCHNSDLASVRSIAAMTPEEFFKAIDERQPESEA